jgi:hypothetical protein
MHVTHNISVKLDSGRTAVLAHEPDKPFVARNTWYCVLMLKARQGLDQKIRSVPLKLTVDSGSKQLYASPATFTATWELAAGPESSQPHQSLA